ncbi:MAG: ssDNA-binding domain-containing protein [Lachnospiraceae bacterium]|nr:ssDNA-binding domain-containing protein [Lachnospiraceae bacterium]
MNSNAEKVKEALTRIEKGLESINTDKDWIKYLEFQSRFYHYSFQNSMMIFVQNPQATYVAGYRAWNKLGRYVKKGSKGLAILAPCIRKVEVFKEPDNKSEYHDQAGETETKQVISGFRVVHVFDIADTDGSDEYLPVLVKGLAGNSDDEKAIYERSLDTISKEFVVREVKGTKSKGSFNLDTKVISVRADLDFKQKIKTILHELAHAYDFEMNPDENIPRNRRELTAESVSFVVSLRLGVDTAAYSMSYLQSWLKDKNELKLVADTVQKLSCRIIDLLAGSSDPAFSMLKEGDDNEQT